VTLENFDLLKLMQNAYDKAIHDRGHINILIAGRTGVGKSTLINAAFQGRMADVGQGRPVTQNTREITKEDIPLSIFDTRGLEMADFAATLQELKTLVEKRKQDSDPNKHIHVGWVCIAEDLRRVERAEEELTEVLSQHMPVVAVITKARADQGFKAEVQKLLPSARNVMRVRAISEEFDDGHITPAMGLEDLINLTFELVPDAHRDAFTAAQKVDITLKKTKAHGIVAAGVSSAIAAALIPLPVADAVSIVTVQVFMLATITAVFGLPIQKGFYAALLGSLVTGGLGTVGGRLLVAGLIKSFPAAGSAVGGTISASVAGTITAGFGETYISVLEFLFANHNGDPPTNDEVIKEFKRRLKKSKR
jgi:uncharacterized protein (DUF697 family)/GTP-binding protein EngB required for normal cell division